MNRTELQEGIKDALKAHDNVKKMTLRAVLAEVKNLEVDTHEEATEQQVNEMVKRVLKQTCETLEGYQTAGDAEHVAEYEARVKILEGCLPEQLSGAALEEAVKEVIASTGASTKKDMGKVMGALNARTQGNFDKAAAARIAGGLLG